MDLFYQGLSREEQLERLKKEFIDIVYKDNRKPSVAKFKLIGGRKENYSNSVLFIAEHVGPKGFMGGAHERHLVQLCNTNDIINRTIVYAWPRKCDTIARIDILKVRNPLYSLVSYIDPKFIVILGDKTTFTFFNKKVELSEDHGKIIGYYLDFPLVLVYPPEYFLSRDSREDKRYKDSILKIDWECIKNEYKRRINATV